MSLDAVVVGAGPNGLAAAITLAEAGRSVSVLEAAPTIGGGCRSAELTLPGFVHDVCSAVHPLAAVSPFFEGTPLADHGLELVQPEVALAHPLDGGRAGVLHQDLGETLDALGADAEVWDRHIGWAARRWDALAPSALGPALRLPSHPISYAKFGLRAAVPSTLFARRFDTPEARGLFAGAAAHAFLPLDQPLTSSFALLLLASGHAAGWPCARGGSQSIVDAMASYLRSLGGTIETNHRVTSMSDLPPSKAILLDLTPRQVAEVCGDELPTRFRAKLHAWRHGPGVFKVDYALSEPVPWTNETCRRAGTVHLGGTLDEVAASEAAMASGRHSERPFVLVAQPSLSDVTRAPEGRHTLWTYCHVPNGSTVDMTDAIEAQIERFAPGFGDVVLERHSADTAWFEGYNENNVGGDISGGSHAGLRLLARPRLSLHPYRTPNRRIFVCSSSTPPGGGVHGMCGMHAARSALSSVLA